MTASAASAASEGDWIVAVHFAHETNGLMFRCKTWTAADAIAEWYRESQRAVSSDIFYDGDPDRHPFKGPKGPGPAEDTK